MDIYKVGDRVHVKRYVPDIGIGTITSVSQERNWDGVIYTGYEVELDSPVQTRWPRYQEVYRLVCCADSLEHC